MRLRVSWDLSTVIRRSGRCNNGAGAIFRDALRVVTYLSFQISLISCLICASVLTEAYTLDLFVGPKVSRCSAELVGSNDTAQNASAKPPKYYVQQETA